MSRVYLLIEIECSKDIPDLKDRVEGRAYTIPGVEKTSSMLLTMPESYKLARAQMDGEKSNG